MPDLWMPGVERHDTGRRLRMQGQHGARIFTWHTFEAPYSLTMNAAWRYLRSQASDPHFVFHPRTGEIVQMLPATTGGRTLRAPNWRTTPTNTYGKIHMQVEVIAYARNPWTDDLTRDGLAGLQRLMDYLRSWGIPDQWAGGVSPSHYYGHKSRHMPDGSSGHTAHSLWRGNTHWDPGAMADPWDLAPAPTAPKPTPAPAPAPEEEFDMSDAQYGEVKAALDDIQNVLNHHIRGDLSKADKEALGTSRNLPLRDVIALTGGRVNTLRARQWDVIKATDAVVDALQRRGATVDADTRAAITAALQED